MDIDYGLLPEGLRGGARLWIENGIMPGSFLSAVIHNDLTGALGNADENNLLMIRAIVSFWYNEAPAGCWGSQEKAKEWKKAKREGAAA